MSPEYNILMIEIFEYNVRKTVSENSLLIDKGEESKKFVFLPKADARAHPQTSYRKIFHTQKDWFSTLQTLTNQITLWIGILLRNAT